MAQEHDRLASLLFPEGGGSELVNFKLFRSRRDAVSVEDVRDEIHGALLQAWVAKTICGVTEVPRTEGKKVNVAELAKNL